MNRGRPKAKLVVTQDERVVNLIKTTLHTKPANGSTHWRVRGVAAETGISKTSVQRYFQLFGLQPHRSEGFKLSTDPFFVEKLRDVVGLYLSPPDNEQVAVCSARGPEAGCVCRATQQSPRGSRRGPPPLRHPAR